MVFFAMVKTATALKDTDAETPSGKRPLIVEAATRVFLDLGYGAASMDAIAAEAGVSKQTVYSHFGAKDGLFGAIIEDKCDELLAPVFEPFRPGRDHGKALIEVARRFLSAILAPPNTALFRVIIAESGRFPELANAFYRAGPKTAVDNLAGYLKELNGAGVIATNDPMASARQFFALLRGDLYMRRLLDLTPEPTAAEVAAVADEAVSGFLAIHAPG
jgi:TetR/AcrR family transcriptional repressor of mexJK operon